MMKTLDRRSVDPNYYDTLSMASLIAKVHVPEKHKQLAINYTVMKKIFGFSAVAAKITNYEMAILKKRNLQPLENLTIRQMNQEIELIKNWANSKEPLLTDYADKLFEIRVKELKYLKACNYFPQGELADGYMALEKYLEYLAK